MTTVLANPGLANPGLAESGDAVLRPHAEQEHRAELDALAAADDRPRPPGWRLSPWAVTVYLLGGAAPDPRKLRQLGDQPLDGRGVQART